MMKEHMTKVMNKKKSGGNRQSGQMEKGASVNQVDGDESVSGLASEASVTHIRRIQSQVAHMTFVKNKHQRMALH